MAGDPEVITAMEEASKLLQQIKLEAVQQDALTLQYLVGRYTTACARMAQAAMEGACVLRSLQVIYLLLAWQINMYFEDTQHIIIMIAAQHPNAMLFDLSSFQ